DWRQDFENSRLKKQLSPALESHLAKYCKLVPALALINHLADGGMGPIGGRPMLRALGMAYYLGTHAQRAYGAGTEAEVSAAEAILSHIRKGHLKDGFSARDVHRPRWSGLTEHAQVQAGLDLLTDLDWIASQDVRFPITGGRPT